MTSISRPVMNKTEIAGRVRFSFIEKGNFMFRRELLVRGGGWRHPEVRPRPWLYSQRRAVPGRLQVGRVADRVTADRVTAGRMTAGRMTRGRVTAGGGGCTEGEMAEGQITEDGTKVDCSCRFRVMG
jgi:hypothetical protein